MKRVLGWAAAFVLLAVPARAGDSLGISIGYSFLKYLEAGGGEAPPGFFLPLSGHGKSAVELALAYHHDTGQLTEGPDIFDTKLDTFTALAGPRIGPAPRYGQTGGARPYLHIPAGLRKDWLQVVGRDK